MTFSQVLLLSWPGLARTKDWDPCRGADFKAWARCSYATSGWANHILVQHPIKAALGVRVRVNMAPSESHHLRLQVELARHSQRQ